MFTTLGCLFTILWFDMYFTTNSAMSSETKLKYFYLLSSFFILINLTNLILHLVLSLSTDYEDADKKFIKFNILNNVLSFICSASLIGSAYLTTKHFLILFPGKYGKKVTKRILTVSLILAFSFEIKAVFPNLIRHVSKEIE